jgi:hypothetical protein
MSASESRIWPQLKEQVAARNLPTLSSLMEKFALPGAFDPLVTMDPQLEAPPNQGRLELLRQLVRRGLDPLLVKPLLAALENHPLERALVAWDALAGALLPEGDPFVEELRQAARPLKSVLPARGIDLKKISSQELIRRFSGSAQLDEASLVALLGGAYEHQLAAFEELHRRGDEMVEDHRVHVALRSLARVLQLAHLPSLAAVYFDYLSRALGHRKAAFDFCETLLDAELPQLIPADEIRGDDAPEWILKDASEYLIYRTYVNYGHAADAWEVCEQNRVQRPKNAPPPSPRLLVGRAHLANLLGKKASNAGLDQICAADPAWRFAARVRVACAAAASTDAASGVPLQLLHDFIVGFGNDRRCWHEALDAAPPNAIWKRDGARLLGREAQHLPHERAVWEVLAMFMANPATIQRVVDEIDAQLARQSRL